MAGENAAPNICNCPDLVPAFAIQGRVSAYLPPGRRVYSGVKSFTVELVARIRAAQIKQASTPHHCTMQLGVRLIECQEPKSVVVELVARIRAAQIKQANTKAIEYLFDQTPGRRSPSSPTYLMVSPQSQSPTLSSLSHPSPIIRARPIGHFRWTN